MNYNNRNSNCSCARNASYPGMQCNTRPVPQDSMGSHSHNRFDKEPLAMAYVPWQHFSDLYPPCKALSEGTAFPELNKIFCGVRG